ncbi:MAG: M56 family metallopeptidase [Acidobacteriales bacterium]|nr:M56 family metallopeptidase [Terriglobales bacterium]
MTPATLQALAPEAVGMLLNSLPAGALISLGAWLLLRLVGRQNSGTRFAIWFSSLLMIAAVPLLATAPAHTSLGSYSSHLLSLPSSWAALVLAVWAMVAGTLLLRVGFGLWHVRALHRSCIPVVAEKIPAEVLQTLNSQNRRRAVLCTSELARVPAALGFFKPLVVIPSWALRDFSSTELNAVVLHELAHLDRWDDWSNLAQKVLRAVFFFHPAMWWIDTRLSLEREMACDDLVLARTANPRQYAECLVSLVEKSMLRRPLAMAQAAVGRISDTAARLAQILDRNRPSGTRTSNTHVLAAVGMLVLGTAWLAPRAQWVSFESSSTTPLPQVAAIPAVPQPFVIPAAHRVVNAPVPVPVPRRSKAVSRPSTPAPVEVFEARALAPAAPNMVEARLHTATPSQTLYVIQTTFDASGNGSWRIEVVRFTLTPAQTAQPVTPAKIT